MGLLEDRGLVWEEKSLVSKKIHFFNMIEILLALTVIAIGMTSVLGLFPVGLNASRNAIAQNCSADVADQIITYLRVMGEASTPSSASYDNTFDPDLSLETELPDYAGLNITNDTTIDIRDGATGVTTSNIQTMSDNFLEDYKICDFTNRYTRVATGWAIFCPKITSPTPTNLRRRVYFIVQGPNCTEGTLASPLGHPVDYSAMALVWKSPVQIIRLIPNGDPNNSADWQKWPPDTDVYSNVPTNTIIKSGTAYDISGKLNIELSWPLTLPYAERKKRYYQVVITNPSP